MSRLYSGGSGHKRDLFIQPHETFDSRHVDRGRINNDSHCLGDGEQIMAHTNRQKAALAHATLATFAAAVGMGGDFDKHHADDRQDALGDLLTNLMHMADQDPGLDFAAALETAGGNFDEEVFEETDHTRDDVPDISQLGS